MIVMWTLFFFFFSFQRQPFGFLVHFIAFCVKCVVAVIKHFTVLRVGAHYIFIWDH